MKKAFVIFVILLFLPLTSCASFGISNQEGGTIIGAVAGGIVGSQFGGGAGRIAATLAGVVIGGIIGNKIGENLDEADRQAAAEAEYSALEYGRTGVATPWRNPDTGHYGTVVAGNPYKNDRYFCREFTHTIHIDGSPTSAKGTACREEDGTWRIVP
ncbi:MAG: RT0821/Lpp0805 family surface protein [Pseudomonadota bacterium]